MTKLLLLLSLVGCGDRPPAVECVDAGDCDGLSVCTEAGTCRIVQCLDSNDCALGAHCDTDAHQCFTGCQRNEDCTVGQTCDTETTTCIPGQCVDPVTDCWPGEACIDGACAMPPGQCEPCTTSTADPCVVDHGGTCRPIYGVNGYDYYCLTPCDPLATDPLPRDFICDDVSYTTTPAWRFWGDCTRATQAHGDEE